MLLRTTCSRASPAWVAGDEAAISAAGMNHVQDRVTKQQVVPWLSELNFVDRALHHSNLDSLIWNPNHVVFHFHSVQYTIAEYYKIIVQKGVKRGIW
jgi:hypothetical protein